MYILKEFLKKNSFIIIICLIALATGLINYNVHLYSDDFNYVPFQLAKGDFNSYINRHIHHYTQINGRAIVYFLTTSFLDMDIRIWQIVNSLMLSGIALFGTLIIVNTNNSDNKNNKKATLSYLEILGNYMPSQPKRTSLIYKKLVTSLIFFTSIAFMNIDMTRQSVYWLTGSFNYVYPIFMLLLYWYMLSKMNTHKKLHWITPIFAFLSASTVEQVCLMSFGLTILTIFEQKYIRNNKINKMLIYSLIASTIGMLTVLMAPATSVRRSLEHPPVDGFIELLKFNINHQGQTFLFSKIMMPYLLMAILSSLGILFYYRNKDFNKYKKLHFAISLLGLSSSLCWLWKITNTYSIKNLNLFDLLFVGFIGVGILTLLIYTAILVCINKTTFNYFLPLIAIILCIGSQAMLVISPVYGPRNLITAVFMLTLYSASIIPNLYKINISIFLSILLCYLYNIPLLLPINAISILIVYYYKQINLNKNNIYKSAIIISYLSIAFVSCSVMKESIDGYYKNAQVYETNLNLAREYIRNNCEGQLEQYKFPDNRYAWAMPYINPFYKRTYNMYLGIAEDSEIIWK